MTKAGQTVGQERDEVGQPPEAVVSVPWTPRTDGLNALLVSERVTVFDRPLPVLQPKASEPDVATALGPVPTVWTWDLVHCRLLTIHAMAGQLPRLQVPATYRSFLGNLQPQEASRRSRVLTAEDTRRFDWTMSRVDCWPEIDRIVIKCIMSGVSQGDIAKATKAWANRFGGKGLSKTSVHRRYRTIFTMMAAEWADLGEPIDKDTRECWLQQASRAG